MIHGILVTARTDEGHFSCESALVLLILFFVPHLCVLSIYEIQSIYEYLWNPGRSIFPPFWPGGLRWHFTTMWTIVSTTFSPAYTSFILLRAFAHSLVPKHISSGLKQPPLRFVSPWKEFVYTFLFFPLYRTKLTCFHFRPLRPPNRLRYFVFDGAW